MEDKIYRDARRQVRKKKGFYVHFSVFIAVGLFFFLMNMLTSPGDYWFFFPMLPWGVGLAIHYLVVFGLPGTDILTDEWEKREMEQELHKRGFFQGDKSARSSRKTMADEEGLDLNAPRKVKEKRRPDEDEFV